MYLTTFTQVQYLNMHFAALYLSIFSCCFIILLLQYIWEEILCSDPTTLSLPSYYEEWKIKQNTIYKIDFKIATLTFILILIF